MKRDGKRFDMGKLDTDHCTLNVTPASYVIDLFGPEPMSAQNGLFIT